MKFKYPKFEIDESKYSKYKSNILDKQLYKLPEKVVFCKKCVQSNQRPRTFFNEKGICSACEYAEKKFGGQIDFKSRENELKKLLDKHRSKNGSFDVVVPSSGGKDSGLVAHQLKTKYGMNPLSVTWAPHIYTEIGFENYVNMCNSGFDGIVGWPDGILHRKLSRISFELKGDPFEPFVFGQKSFAYHISTAFNIPLIFYGENGEVEYGGSMKNVNKSHETVDDWNEFYFKGTGVDDLVLEGHKMGILLDNEIQLDKFKFYKPPKKEKIKSVGTEMHWWSYYKTWIPQENFYYCVENTGFEPNTKRTQCTYTKSNSIDDRLDNYHFFLAYIKFGYGRATRDACSDIRCGHITREEAVQLVNKYDHEFPKEYFEEFLEYLSIKEDKFWSIVNFYRNRKVWSYNKKNNIWELNKKVENN